MDDDDSGGSGSIGGGGKDKGKNKIKHEAEARRKAQQDLPQEIAIPPPLRDFGDGSQLIFDWTSTHLDLLGSIVEQTEDDCWARVLGKILEFVYNKDIDAIAERKPLSIRGLISHVIFGREDFSNQRGSGQVENLAVCSLRRAIQFIKEEGLEKDFGRNQGDNTFKVKGHFRSEPNATPDRIIDLLPIKGPVGFYAHMVEEFRELKSEIYLLHVPKEDVIARYKRHVLIIVAHGMTADGRLFFWAQNTWGETWGVNGYGRIIIVETCPIFYLDRLL